MPAVNRESLMPVHSAELEQAEAPGVGTPVVSQQQVESFDEATSSSIVQHGLAVGSIAASSVRSLDAKAVVAQVKELMGGWLVSGDDCRHAVGLLQSLPPAQYARALRALSESGELKTLCEKTPAELRRELAESAVQGGATTSTPERLSRGLKDPQPPAQPAMIVNSPSLPKELREVIHQENQARAQQYQQAFGAYVDAWCAKVAGCKTPMELRALGPVANPPALLEPGICDADFAAKRFTSLNCRTNLGVERAAKAVSAQVSVFRKELAAGGFGIDFEVKAKFTAKAEGKWHTEGAVGTGVVAKGTFTDDGRVIKAKVAEESVLEGGVHGAKLEGKFDAAGHLEEVSGEVLGAGIELERDGEVTFKAPTVLLPGVSVETLVNGNEATYGARVVGEEEGELGFGTLKVEAKIGFTAKGVAREYYEDIGGAQQGFFGPMPELEAGAKWSELTRERREWYGRQGFDATTWP